MTLDRAESGGASAGRRPPPLSPVADTGVRVLHGLPGRAVGDALDALGRYRVVGAHHEGVCTGGRSRDGIVDPSPFDPFWLASLGASHVFQRFVRGARAVRRRGAC